jgi:hypothetical protein
MALALGSRAYFEEGTSFLEVWVDDADIDPNLVTDKPLAAARIRHIRLVTNTRRGLWVRCVDSSRPNNRIIDISGRGRIVDDVTFDLSVGRRVNLGELSFEIGTE